MEYQTKSEVLKDLDFNLSDCFSAYKNQFLTMKDIRDYIQFILDDTSPQILFDLLYIDSDNDYEFINTLEKSLTDSKSSEYYKKVCAIYIVQNLYKLSEGFNERVDFFDVLISFKQYLPEDMGNFIKEFTSWDYSSEESLNMTKSRLEKFLKQMGLKEFSIKFQVFNFDANPEWYANITEM